MINNQIVSVAKDKGDLFTGQTGNGTQKGESKPEGGLFKLLMNSVQLEENGEHTAGNWGSQKPTSNIIGSNLLNDTGSDGESEEDRIVNILAGLDESAKKELVIISEMLNGQGISRLENDTDSENDTDTEENADTETSLLTDLESVNISDVDSGKKENAEKSTEKIRDEFEYEENAAKLTNSISGAENTANTGDQEVKDEEITESQNISYTGKTVTGSNSETDNDADNNTDNDTEEDQIDSRIHFGEEISNDREGTDEKTNLESEISLKTGDAENKLDNEQVSNQFVQTVQSAVQGSGDEGKNENLFYKETSENVAAGEAKGKTSPVAKNVQQPAQPVSTIESKDESLRSLFQFEDQKDVKINSEVVKPDAESGENEKLSGSDKPVKIRGIVNQLRAFAASQQFTGQPIENSPATEAAEKQPDDTKILQTIFNALSNGNIDLEAAEVRSLKANQLREMRSRNYQSSFTSRLSYSASEGHLTTTDSSMISESGSNNLNMISTSGIVPTNASVSMEQMKEDGAILWKEHIAEFFESTEKNTAENQAAFAKLSEVPVTNISVRRNFAMSLGQAIMSATGDGKKAAETWQKHSFVLENGKNIQLSARQVDGVLQLRLSSSNVELNKLLMDHQNDIRDHLEKEIDVSIDLQLDMQGEGQATDLFSGSGGQEPRGSQAFEHGSAKLKEQNVDEVVPKAVRKFGYNQMEWTA